MSASLSLRFSASSWPLRALAVDPERICAVVNLRHAVLSSGRVAIVADAVASSKGSRRTCDDNNRQSQHDFGLHSYLLLVLEANFLCRSDWGRSGVYSRLVRHCAERFDFVLDRT